MTERFSLEKHDGPYEKWPLRSSLLDGTTHTGLKLPGYTLLAQSECAGGYLFITDCDCPHEECTYICLVDSAFRLLSYRVIVHFLFEKFERVCDERFVVTFHGGRAWEGQVRQWGIPYLRPRIRLTRRK